MAIPARLSLATLGVRDVRASTAFYVALGWPLSPASQEGDISFFDTAGGLLGLYGDSDLARDVGMDAELAPPAFRGVTLAINLESEDAVDDAFAQVRVAGGEVVKPPERVSWGGYSGYFADPDGHIWEIAYNPGFPLGDDGLPRLPSSAP